MKTRKWIYVTGVPRSGTTFVGKMLSIPIEANYLHEPFNPRCGMPEIDHPYLYLRSDTHECTPYTRSIENLFADNFTLKTGRFKEDAPWRSFLKSVVGSSAAWSVRLTKLNPMHTTWIIKDPIGCLLTEYLTENYDVHPVILVRHPAAVVASVMRLGWSMDLNPICNQPDLLKDHFPESSPIFKYRDSAGIEGAAALWSALNTVILRQADRNPSWIVLTHEEICQQPVKIFHELYSRLGLRWSDCIEKRILKFTGDHNPRAANEGAVHSFKRNSLGLLDHSLRLLSREQREKIFYITRDVATRFYPTESFKLGDF